jgi:hypothetical protein
VTVRTDLTVFISTHNGVVRVLCGGGDGEDVDEVAGQCATQNSLFADARLERVVLQFQQVVLATNTTHNDYNYNQSQHESLFHKLTLTTLS